MLMKHRLLVIEVKPHSTPLESCNLTQNRTRSEFFSHPRVVFSFSQYPYQIHLNLHFFIIEVLLLREEMSENGDIIVTALENQYHQQNNDNFTQLLEEFIGYDVNGTDNITGE